MTVQFPNYFEFESINPSYSLSPNTRNIIQDNWFYFLTNERRLINRAPEGILLPMGFIGIQKRMAEVKYLVIVPKELSEEIIRVVQGLTRNTNAAAGPVARGVENEKEDHFKIEDCPVTHEVENELGEDLPEDPLPGIPSPWPWDITNFPDKKMPISGNRTIQNPNPAIPGIGQVRHINFIHTYDYYGQYYSSAISFCWAMQHIPGITNYAGTLALLEHTIQQDGDAPIIVMCPENISADLANMPELITNGAIEPNNPHALYAFGLRKVLLHEMGHHIFPVVYDGNRKSSKYWPECMANWFTYHMLPEPERLGLYMWTLKQPLEYRSYIALLGLSMANKRKTVLSRINRVDRKSLIDWFEYVCSHGFIPDKYVVPQRVETNLERSYLFYERRRRRLPLLLVTPAEAIWQKLFDGRFYNNIFCTFQLFMQAGLRIRKATIAEFNTMIKEEAERLPISIGSLRSDNYDIDFFLD